MDTEYNFLSYGLMIFHKRLAHGGEVLLHFLQNTDYAATFGYDIPQKYYNNKCVKFQQFVGSGRFGNVYQVSLGADKSCLIKIHKDQTSLEWEKENLKLVRNHSKEIQACGTFMFTHLVGVTDDQLSLLVEPRGIPFAQTPAQLDDLLTNPRIDIMAMSQELLLSLVDAVRFLHKKIELVHRDIKLSNMFALQDEVIMLLRIGLTRTLTCMTPQSCVTLTPTCVSIFTHPFTLYYICVGQW